MSPESEAGDQPAENAESPGASSRPSERRRSLTPEQRRLLGAAPTYRDQPAESAAPIPREPKPEALAPRVPRPAPKPAEPSEAAASKSEVAATNREARGEAARANLTSRTQAARTIELRSAVLVIGALLFLAIVFYAGRKFDRLRYMVTAQKRAAELEAVPEKFRDLSVDELLETALTAEKGGAWPDAVERLMAAKRKNLALPGILYRIGKGSFDRGDFAVAETALSHALKFNENVASSNYYLGLIAVQRHDLPAATRFFEAATQAEPFVSDMYYHWAEALRLDQHPRDAIRRYEQSVQRTSSADDAALCRFKIRLARLEAAEAASVKTELEQVRAAGPLTVDWLMTDAAVHLQEGKIAEASALIAEARGKGMTALFLTCSGDTIFRKSAQSHPEIAHSLTTVQAPSP